MEVDYNLDGETYRIEVTDFEDEDQPEYVPITQPALYIPDGGDEFYIAFSEQCTDACFLKSPMEPDVVYKVEKA